MNLGFDTYVIMTMHLSFAHGYYNINSEVTSSPHLMFQCPLDLENEKYLVANIEIGRFCTNLNVYTWIFVFCTMPITPFKDHDLGWQYQR
jgi:hypothetical protein